MAVPVDCQRQSAPQSVHVIVGDTERDRIELPIRNFCKRLADRFLLLRARPNLVQHVDNSEPSLRWFGIARHRHPHNPLFLSAPAVKNPGILRIYLGATPIATLELDDALLEECLWRFLGAC